MVLKLHQGYGLQYLPEQQMKAPQTMRNGLPRWIPVNKNSKRYQK
jgi:hypothetical protein